MIRIVPLFRAALSFRIHHDQQAADKIRPERDKALLAFGIRVFPDQRALVIENADRIREINAMLSKIRGTLGFVPFETHAYHCMHRRAQT